MKVSSSVILLLILIYPFFYANSFIAFEVSYRFSLYYFIPLTLFLCYLNLGPKSAHLMKENSVNLMLLGLIILIVLLRTDNPRFSKPLLFFVYVLNLYLLSLNVVFRENGRLIGLTFIIFVAISVIYMFREDRYLSEHRYLSFLVSPTVFSVYAEVFLILCLYHTRNLSMRFLFFILTGIFIIMTKTRLNMFFYFSIPVLFYFFENYRISRWKVLLIYIICLNLLYPIYSYVVKFDLAKTALVTTRYEDGRDSSFGLRNYLNAVTYNEYMDNTTVFQKLFGTRTEGSRRLIIDLTGHDLKPHNDFIRFVYDFGIVCALLFLVFLYRVSRLNYLAFILLLLYLFSFYHNMIYDFFLVSILIYYNGIRIRSPQQAVVTQPGG